MSAGYKDHAGNQRSGRVARPVKASARRKRSRALDDVLAGHAGLLDVIPDPVFAWGGGEGILSWNAAARELYGYTREQAVGQVSHELLQTGFPEDLTSQEVEAILAERG